MKKFMFLFIMSMVLMTVDISAQTRQSDGSVIGANATVKATVIMEGGQYTHRYIYRQASVYFRPTDATLVLANSPQMEFHAFEDVRQMGTKTRYIAINRSGISLRNVFEIWVEDGKIYYIDYRVYDRDVLQEHIQAYTNL